MSHTRNNVVVAKGNPLAKIFIIGEAPGEKEDITGFPFVGRAGKMLNTVLHSVDIDPLEDCYITNIVKCRPVSYTHLRAHETVLDLVCRLLLEKKK